MVVPLSGDHVAAPPSALSIGERGPQFAIHAESDIRWPAGSLQSYLFLCNQNNSSIHQPRINTIHLDSSPLWLETRRINSFSIETTTNAGVKRYKSSVHVWPSVSRRLYEPVSLSNVH